MKMKTESLFIGIDVGGTNTVVGLVDAKGTLLKQARFSTQAQAPITVFFNNLTQTIRQLTNSDADKIAGIGIGAPSVNSKSGYLENPKNFKWGRIHLSQMLEHHFKRPVKIINDADAAALGELYFGHGRHLNNFVHITLGTGLGGSIIVNRQLVSGHDGFAGEFGHTKIEFGDRLCSCGKRGCLETYVSAKGICRTAFELISREATDSLLTKYAFENLTPKIIFELANQGDALAIKTFAVTGRILGSKLADLIALLNPEAIIFSGGLTNAGHFLFDPMKKAMEENLLEIHRNSFEIHISDTQKNFAVLGTAALMMKRLN